MTLSSGAVYRLLRELLPPARDRAPLLRDDAPPRALRFPRLLLPPVFREEPPPFRDDERLDDERPPRDFAAEPRLDDEDDLVRDDFRRADLPRLDDFPRDELLLLPFDELLPPFFPREELPLDRPELLLALLDFFPALDREEDLPAGDFARPCEPLDFLLPEERELRDLPPPLELPPRPLPIASFAVALMDLPLAIDLPAIAPITPPTAAPIGPAMLPTKAPAAAPAAGLGMGGISMFSFDCDDGCSVDCVSGFCSSGISGCGFLQVHRIMPASQPRLRA